MGKVSGFEMTKAIIEIAQTWTNEQLQITLDMKRISRTDIDYRIPENRIYGLQLPASDMWTHTHSSMGVQRANTSICTCGLKRSGLTQNLCLTHVLQSGLKRRVYHPIA
jgi:hypothetical protein